MLFMETAMKIRRLVLVDGQSIHSVSRSTGISRTTIRKYLKDESPPTYRRVQTVECPKMDPFKERLEGWFRADQSRSKRERRTAQKLFEQLQLEGYEGSYTTVSRFIKQLKGEAARVSEAYVPLCFDPGDAMQFDWSQEAITLAGVDTTIRVAHFRLANSRKPFVYAYLRESQEMILDAFNRALAFYQGVPRRVLIDNPKTMVTRIGKGKERDFHPRFFALMNHYLLEPVACTPAAGWEKGQVENQVQGLRNQLFKPKLNVDTLDELNGHLQARCEHIAQTHLHPGRKDSTIDEIFIQEAPHLLPLGKAFDGYIEKSTRVLSTCLVRYDNNHYSVPAKHARQVVSLRAYADRIVIVNDNTLIAEHPRSFDKHSYHFEPWHYVPVLERKPGALRNGAPFQNWELPNALKVLKQQYLQRAIGGDKDFVQLLLLIQEHDMETVETACELALENKTTQLSAIVNLVHRLTEPNTVLPVDDSPYPTISTPPVANCHRYDQLRISQECRL